MSVAQVFGFSKRTAPKQEPGRARQHRPGTKSIAATCEADSENSTISTKTGLTGSSLEAPVPMLSEEKQQTLDDGLIMMCQNMTKRWLNPRTFFRSIDLDASQRITRDELEKYVADHNFGHSQHFMDLLWDVFDHRQKGYITEDDFVEGMEMARHAEEQMMYERALHNHKKVKIPDTARFVSLVAHNEMKLSLMEFVHQHIDFFQNVPIVTTNSTGRALEKLGLYVGKKVKSGPLGGDQEVGAMLCNGHIAAIFFFKDPLTAQPHQADIEALTRVADCYSVPYATNLGTSQLLITSLKTVGLQWRASMRESVDVMEKYKEKQNAVIKAVGEEQHEAGGMVTV